MADLLTSPEVAELLGTTLRTVQRMAKGGRLPVAQKLPGEKGAYLFRRADIGVGETDEEIEAAVGRHPANGGVSGAVHRNAWRDARVGHESDEVRP